MPSPQHSLFSTRCAPATFTLTLCLQALSQLPPSHPHAVEFRSKLVAMAATLKAAQGADGLWRSSLADPSHFPNPCVTPPSTFFPALVALFTPHPPDGALAPASLAHSPPLLACACLCSETTSSSCFTYGLAYGVNAGILPAAEYTPVVAAAWAGLASIALQPNGLVGWCQPAAGSPGPALQNSTSDFCVGQFLLAGSQVLRLAEGAAAAQH
jgi:hypothetical protein